jgi:1-acyl-sn-glycerol-3-phosphate acyltransferase
MPARSAWAFDVFRRYARKYVGRHFHALRVSGDGLPPQLAPEPVIVIMNHPSWWDPMIGLVLTTCMPSSRRHFAPIDEKGLAQYRFLERLGFFGIEPGTPRGSLSFLRKSLAILSDSESVLWVTAQGEFTDPRERPIRLKPGVGHLAARLSRGIIVPMALEYPFWNDRCPEALVRFGTTIDVDAAKADGPGEWTARLEQALEETQDRLAAQARLRDPTAFQTLLGGASGVGGVYDLWRRLRARLRGESFHPEHRLSTPPRS